MNLIGKIFLLDYGQFLVKVHYLTEERLKWEQIKGSSPGLTAEETYNSTEIRNDIHMMSWQEKDGSIVVQVLDWEMQKVYTTWISSDKTMHNFQGSIRIP